MALTDYQTTDRRCEDCGGVVVAGWEPITASEDPELIAPPEGTVVSEWCANPDCPSNHILAGLRRIGVCEYVCKVCGEVLRAPLGEVFAHRRTHRHA